MVAVQWYPGHMEKARRDMQDTIKQVDMVIEVRDARIPLGSANPILDTMAQGKPRLIVLSKADLADEAETAKWIQVLSEKNAEVLALNLQNDRSSRKQIISAASRLTKAKRDYMIGRGIRPRAMRAMACGIPNSGKSTLINRIAGKNAVKTADKPGVTRSLAWIHADATLDILDTPGVLWPKFDNPLTGTLLAATGAINENILDLKTLTLEVIAHLRTKYAGELENAYGITAETESSAVLHRIAEARHLMATDDETDVDRAASVFLHELRRGKLGRITLEWTDETDKDLHK